MVWILIVIGIIVLAVKTDGKYETSCLSGLLVLGGGALITIVAFVINPILGIIVGFFVYQGWKNM